MTTDPWTNFETSDPLIRSFRRRRCRRWRMSQQLFQQILTVY